MLFADGEVGFCVDVVGLLFVFGCCSVCCCRGWSSHVQDCCLLIQVEEGDVVGDE